MLLHWRVGHTPEAQAEAIEVARRASKAAFRHFLLRMAGKPDTPEGAALIKDAKRRLDSLKKED